MPVMALQPVPTMTEGQQIRARTIHHVGRWSGMSWPLREQEESVLNQLAVDIFNYQFRNNPAYAHFCRQQGVDPSTLSAWTQIPAVVTDAFKVARLACFPPEECVATFMTSGTTQGRRGQHEMATLEVYRAALAEPFRRFCQPESARMTWMVLTPPYAEDPQSSLGFMVDELWRVHASDRSRRFFQGDEFDVEAAWQFLQECVQRADPVMLLGTAFAYIHLLDHAQGRRLVLPPGSRLMETGGFKGKTREVSRPELRQLMWHHLGLPAPMCVGEYGMTELTSQLYEVHLPEADNTQFGPGYYGPPWLKVRVVDVMTLQPLPPGEVGLVQFFDLTNVDSVCAILTADLGKMEAEGGLSLLGRASGANLRGCSLKMEEWLASRRTIP